MARLPVGAVLLPLLAACLAGCAQDDGGPGAAAAAPSGSGSLAGLVVDEAVRPLAAAAVTASGTSGSFNATTGPDGLFRFDGLAPGVYLVEVRKPFYSSHQQAVPVVEGVEPELARFQLAFEATAVPYVDLYKFDGLFECGVWPTNGCANVNIVTGIMLCSLSLPCFNTTGDRSVELIWIDAPPTFLQSEMVWEPTSDTGRAMDFGLFAATREELQDGFADGYNYTTGESPLMLQLHGADLEESRIGLDGRQLGIQVSVGVSTPIPGGCVVLDPCGVGVSAQQAYTTFTHAFYGYRPPAGWLFTESGAPPPT